MVEEIYKNVKAIKQKAISKKIPVIADSTLDFIIKYLNKKNVTSILEIGTGIGFSTIMFALARPDARIISIEKDQKRYMEALKNIKKLKLEDRISLIYNDAMDMKFTEKFDFIFIDAQKSKAKELFDLYEKNLENHGTIITNDISFHGLVKKDLKDIKDKKIQAIVTNIKDYINYLENNLKYKTSFYEVGDGISLSEKRL